MKINRVDEADRFDVTFDNLRQAELVESHVFGELFSRRGRKLKKAIEAVRQERGVAQQTGAETLTFRINSEDELRFVRYSLAYAVPGLELKAGVPMGAHDHYDVNAHHDLDSVFGMVDDLNAVLEPVNQ